MRHKFRNQLLRGSRQIVLWGPLVATPLMLNVRWFYLGNAPNEYPKWAVLVLLAVLLSAATLLLRHGCCVRARRAGAIDQPPALGVSGWLMVLYLLGLGWGCTYAPNTDMACIRLFFAFAFVMVWYAVVWAVASSAGYVRYLGMALVAGAGLLAASFLVTWSGELPFNGADWPVHFSNIGHQNFTGDVLVVLIPLLAWFSVQPGLVVIRAGAGLSLLVCLGMLVNGGMLGAIAGLALGFAIAGMLWLAAGRWAFIGQVKSGSLIPQSPWVWGFLLSLVLVAAFFRQEMVQSVRQALVLSSWEISPAEATERAEPQPPFADQWHKLSGVFGRRVPMWAATTGMIADRPWTGFGTGTFAAIYPAYSDRYPQFRDPENLGGLIKTNPHNAYLQVAAENGLPMLGLFFGLLCILGGRLVRWHWRSGGVGSFSAVWAFFAMVFDAGFNHVFFNPASLFMVALAFGFWWAKSGDGCTRSSACLLWRSSLVGVLALCGVLMLAMVPVRWIISEYHFVAARNHAVHGGSSPRHLMAEWRGVLEWFPENTGALAGLAKVQLQEGWWEGAEETYRALLRVEPYSTPALSGLAAAQLSQGQWKAALRTLQQAQALEPDEPGYARSIDQLRATMPHHSTP